MRLFNCPVCRNLLYFENVVCTQCGHQIGFAPEILSIVALQDDVTENRIPVGASAAYRKCKNYSEHNVCNWLVAESDNEEYCRACRLNDTIPNLATEGNLSLWHTMEKEKRRLIYSVIQLGLPLTGKEQDTVAGLSFSFLSDSPI